MNVETKFKLGQQVVFLCKKANTKQFYQAIVGHISLIKIDDKIRYDSENFHDCYEGELCSAEDAPMRIKELLQFEIDPHYDK